MHSNGLTLARRSLLEDGGLTLDSAPDELGGARVGDTLLEPTVIYVRAVLDLLRGDIPVHGLAHITGDGVLNLLRLGTDVGFEISDPLEVPAIFELIADRGGVDAAEMWEVFNMGCGFCVVVPGDQAAAAIGRLAAHHPGTRQIGTVTDRAATVALPTLGLEGDRAGLRRGG